jgi:hypothetical protein
MTMLDDQKMVACRISAAQRLYRTAQGFSPGSRLVKGALKAAPDVGRAGGITHDNLKTRLGRHFQGGSALRITQA